MYSPIIVFVGRAGVEPACNVTTGATALVGLRDSHQGAVPSTTLVLIPKNALEYADTQGLEPR